MAQTTRTIAVDVDLGNRLVLRAAIEQSRVGHSVTVREITERLLRQALDQIEREENTEVQRKNGREQSQ